jgi:hypothetical protein
MNAMELRVWRIRVSWPQRQFLGRILWDENAWVLAAPLEPAAEERAEELSAVAETLATMERPAERSEEAVRKALRLAHERIDVRSTNSPPFEYGPVLDMRLSYECPRCRIYGRLRRSQVLRRLVIPGRTQWRVSRKKGHPDEHKQARECRHCAFPWKTNGTGAFESLPLAPRNPSRVWKKREARHLFESLRQAIFSIDPDDSLLGLRRVTQTPQFARIMCAPGLEPFYAIDPCLRGFFPPQIEHFIEGFAEVDDDEEFYD